MNVKEFLRSVAPHYKHPTAKQKEKIEATPAFDTIAPELQTNTDVQIHYQKMGWPILRFLSPEQRDNAQLVNKFVCIEPSEYQYASERIRSSPELTIECVSQPEHRKVSGVAFVSKVLRSKSFPKRMPEARSLVPSVAQYFSGELKNNDLFMLACAALDNPSDRHSTPTCLAHASEDLRSDKEKMLPLLELSPQNVQWVGEALKDDEELLRKIFKRSFGNTSHHPIKYVSDRLRDSKEFALFVLEQQYGTCAYRHLSPELRADREIALKVSRSPHELQHADPSILKDRDFLLSLRAAFKLTPSILEFVHPKLRADVDFLQSVARLNPLALSYASPTLLKAAGLKPLSSNADTKAHIRHSSQASEYLNSLKEKNQFATALGEGKPSSKKNIKI